MCIPPRWKRTLTLPQTHKSSALKLKSHPSPWQTRTRSDTHSHTYTHTHTLHPMDERKGVDGLARAQDPSCEMSAVSNMLTTRLLLIKANERPWFELSGCISILLYHWDDEVWELNEERKLLLRLWDNFLVLPFIIQSIHSPHFMIHYMTDWST